MKVLVTGGAGYIGSILCDHRYFNLLGQPGVKCFLAECRGRLVHYSWVFLDASLSPIVEVPFDRSQLRAKDAYVGPIFASPDYRGFVYLQVLSAILRFLRDEVSYERALVLSTGTKSLGSQLLQEDGLQGNKLRTTAEYFLLR